jgi:hypothetical protein
MNTGRVFGQKSLKYVRGTCMAILGLFLASVEDAYADLVRYSYTTTAGVPTTASPGVGFISPSSGVSFLVSGGIDRKLRIAVTASGASTPIFTKQSAKLLGATDVVTYNGNSYYGEEFLSPKLPDGQYTVTTDILSSTGAVVQTQNVALIIDTGGPVAGTFYPRPYAWGGPVLSGDTWKLGKAAIDALTYSSFVLEGFSDPSGISKVAARVYRGTGSLYKEYNVLFSEATKSASIQYRTNFFPDSDLDEVFGLEFVITDKAGNVSTTSRQKVMFDSIGNAPAEPFGVYDPAVTTTLAPGLTGFVPYVAGAFVKTNPIRLAWRIPKSNWSTYRQGGLTFVNLFGENQVAGTDADYVYLIGSLPYRSEDVNYIRFYNFGEWGSQGTIKYDLQLHPDAPRSPVVQKAEYLYSDKGWVSITSRVVTPQELPVTISKVRYTVEARPFDQVATHLGTCTIPAGATQCEITLNRELKKGTSGYMRDQAALRSTDGKLAATALWANVWWNDLYLPALTYSYNATDMILTLRVNQPHQGDYQNNLVHSGAWLEDTSGNKLTVTKKLTSSSGENFEYEFDLKTLPEGTQNLVAVASENLGAITRLPLFIFESDRTSPVITVSKGASESIDTLDKISFTVADAKDPLPKITAISLKGGPANESIALSYRKINATTYGLEYPILFPSLTAGEQYTLTVTAQDAQKNTGVGTTTFLYTPSMAGIIGHTAGLVNVPAVQTDFRRTDGSQLINSEQLKLADGTPVSGVYDLLATLRSDAVSSLSIAGISVQPGSTVRLGQLDFSTSGGKISLPVIPLGIGKVGSNGVIISTSAPNSPVVYANINTWLPKVNLVVNDTKPVQAMTNVTAELTPDALNTCRLTTNVAVAKAADPILSPVCLLEWTSFPQGIQQVDVPGATLPMTRLTGRALNVGRQKIAYTLSIYNKGTDKISLGGSELFVDVTSATASITFGQSLQGRDVNRVLESVSVTMSQLTGPSCAITGLEETARSAGLAAGALTCLVEFTQIPPGLAVESREPLELTGTLTKAGQNPIRWTASVYDTAGNKLQLEQGQSSINVVHPSVTTTLDFEVNESAKADVTPTEDKPEAWSSKSYSVLTNPEHGELTPTAKGFTYTPTAGYVGTDAFTYKVLDASGMAAVGAATVTVEKFNYQPSLVSITMHTREGASTDPTRPHVEDMNLWDSHTFEITQEPQHGTVSVLGEYLQYTPAPGYYGDDVFVFEAIDLDGERVEGHGIVTVDQYNMAPTGISPSEIKMIIGKGGSAILEVFDPNVRDTHSLQVLRQPDHGAVTLNGSRLIYSTRGRTSTSVLIRATDQDGLHLDQNITFELIDRPGGTNIIRTFAPITRGAVE